MKASELDLILEHWRARTPPERFSHRVLEACAAQQRQRRRRAWKLGAIAAAGLTLPLWIVSLAGRSSSASASNDSQAVAHVQPSNVDLGPRID